MSYILRLSSAVEPTERMREVIRQLAGIGGGRPLGFGPNRVRSLPDGVAQAVEDYLKQRKERMEQLEAAAAAAAAGENGKGNGQHHHPEAEAIVPTRFDQPQVIKIGDLCPECGEAAVVNEEGCRKCYACGHSEC